MAEEFLYGESEPILCFQHCHKGTNILCEHLPTHCPLCRGVIGDTPLRIPPFRLPSPFVNAREAPFSVVVKPTQGSFLRHYSRDSNLHIGITNSKGEVYDYDENGVTFHRDGWTECLSVCLVSHADDQYKQWWDTSLQNFSTGPKWQRHEYNETFHNCYDFVLEFLMTIELDQQYPCIKERSQFVQEMIIPKTSQAAKYIAIYRKVTKDGVVIQTKI